MRKTASLYKEAKRMIPGGTQLFSKRPELMLPGGWPAYYRKARGCYIWDLDGKKYMDASYMGIGACMLGYADEDVDKAVISVIRDGSMSTLNPAEEVELSRLLLKIHPWAKMCRFARCGGEAMAIAVRIARAASGKDLVLFSGYHGWHDWYLAANLASDRSLDGHLLPGLHPAGVPRGLKGSSIPFKFNDTGYFEKLVSKYKNKIGAIVVESVRNDYPADDFLNALRRAARELKVPLVVDEITGGFRINPGGAHLFFGLEPDIAVFAKGISNGFPMAAVIGKGKVMQAAQDTFISSTYWTERIGPAASLATIKKIIAKKVDKHLVRAGKAVQEGWKELAGKHKIDIEISGIYPLGHFTFKHPEHLVLKTLFTQLMLERGFLATTAFYVSYAHKDEHIAEYLSATDEAFSFLAGAVRKGNLRSFLKGPVCSSGFKRLT